MTQIRIQSTQIVERLLKSRGGKLAPLVYKYLKDGTFVEKEPTALSPKDATEILDREIKKRDEKPLFGKKSDEYEAPDWLKAA